MDIIYDMVTGLVLSVITKNETTDMREYGPVHEYGSDYEERTGDFS